MAISRIKTWVTEVLMPNDLNNEFDNIINNLTPQNIGDYSSNVTEMRVTVDPYPAGTESLATDTTGELGRLRYLIGQITGKTYWYQDPTTSLLSIPNILGMTATVGTNSLTVTLTDQSGGAISASNAVVIPFRSATIGSGVQINRTVSASTSIVLSAGSSLGFSDNEINRIYVWAIDNSGTVELALSKTPLLYDETNIQSTTAEGGIGSADSSTTVYSTTARTDVPIKPIGYLVIQTGSTAGNWSSNPSTIHVYNGNEERPMSTAGTLIHDSGFLTTAATSITVSNLDGSQHGGYEFELCLVNAYAGAVSVSVYYNGDTTATNYNGSGGNNAIMAAVSQNYILQIKGTISISTDLLVTTYGIYTTNSISDGTSGSNGIFSVRKSAAVTTNLMSLTITTNQSTALGIKTYFRLWRKKSDY